MNGNIMLLESLCLNARKRERDKNCVLLKTRERNENGKISTNLN